MKAVWTTDKDGLIMDLLENEKKRAAYQKSLEKIEGDLEAVEAKYDESKNEGAE